ncbi:MAG TPA: multifunctional CCA addition/repair protein [Steroidobacteraceae bacterium]|jgi:tRNA nucleotidyltransferase (CCA-adding enzyme)|nr:multifunctional CCA addition/repair protein [Steroidobacteraceae bacterium]
MQVYLVGGAVRDRLLGREVKERDWVVVGATPEELERAGYLPVGRDFPVFLHPQTREEHALARLERKTGPGYRGFSTEFSPDVTLEDDLRRRDLTINAMAEDASGSIIDPHGGQRDIEARLLRHVSEAFVEDPVRILRVARFAARYAPLGFSVAGETLALMRRMVESGEADALVAERVWAETEKALAEPRPDVFISVLRDCGALKVIYPELDALFGVPQPEKWHPEIDTGVHQLMALREAVKLGGGVAVRFAVLMHDLGKGSTPADKLPSHPGHEDAGVALVERLAARLRVPNHLRELALITARYHTHVHRAFELRPDTVLKTLESCDAFRRPERFADFLLACEADARGRKGFEQRDYPQRNYFAAARERAAAVAPTEEERRDLSGEQIGQELRRRRIAAIESLKATLPAA